VVKPRLPSEEEYAQWRKETAADVQYQRQEDDGACPLSGAAGSPGVTDAAQGHTRAAMTKKPNKKSANNAPLMVMELSTLGAAAAGKRLREASRAHATLDLHDMNQQQAHRALTAFLAQAEALGLRTIRLITGKGTRSGGVLRRAVVHWLETPALRPQIKALAHAPAREGGEGVLIVLLKHPR